MERANPSVGIKKFKEQKRDRFILHDELPKFMEALESEPNRDMRDFFLMCLYTGARKSNVESMRWEGIDFSINEWRIPDTEEWRSCENSIDQSGFRNITKPGIMRRHQYHGCFRAIEVNLDT
jgi:integrase